MADVVGFSRLMRENEAETLRLVLRFRQDVLQPLLDQHHGRLVKDMGDGFLAVFDSAVRAVECAVGLQMKLAGKVLSMGADPLKVRVGINLGDVIIDGTDVFGDGVNVAARLEPLCQPGGVCLSESVYEQVRDKLTLDFEPMGAQVLKNISRPVSAWLWAGHGTGRKPAPTVRDGDASEKASIAVLAFDNMSADPEQAFFADGIAEDITTALSRIGQFFVVSRTSAFSFKGQALDLACIASKLGVRYVLEGSVRSAAGRLRITAQLIEAGERRHVWARGIRSRPSRYLRCPGRDHPQRGRERPDPDLPRRGGRGSPFRPDAIAGLEAPQPCVEGNLRSDPTEPDKGNRPCTDRH